MTVKYGFARPLFYESEVGRVVSILKQLIDDATRFSARRFNQRRKQFANFIYFVDLL